MSHKNEATDVNHTPLTTEESYANNEELLNVEDGFYPQDVRGWRSGMSNDCVRHQNLDGAQLSIFTSQ